MQPAIHATADFYDDIVRHGRVYDPPQVDALLDYLRGLGVTRLDWHVDTWHDLYERMPYHGHRNILAYVTERAHALGMDVHAVFKPFEMGGLHSTHLMVPHPFPRPQGLPVFDDLNGRHYLIDPFVLEHLDKRLRRVPGDWNPPGRITAVKLVKTDASPADIKAEHLTLWTSRRNGESFLYEKPWTLRETIEERSGQPRRVLTLAGLDLDEEERYIIVRCSRRTPCGTFSNALHDIMEIYAGDRCLPCTPFDEHIGMRKLEKSWVTRGEPIYPAVRALSRYARHPEVLDFVKDRKRIVALYENTYRLDVLSRREWEALSDEVRDDFTPFLDRDHGVMAGFAGVCRGKAEYYTSLLHPIYPEVRRYWLEVTRRCLACGADGVSFRVHNHNRSSEPELYGFNEPVLEATGGSTDPEAVARVNGAAYTQFLREARGLLRAAGKTMTLQIAGDTHHKHGHAPWNFEWPWERWIEEDLADIVYTHARVMDWTEEAAGEFAERVIAKAKAHGKPVIWKSGVAPGTVAQSLRYARRHPRGIDAVNLYETANFTRIRENGVFEGSAEIADVVNQA